MPEKESIDVSVLCYTREHLKAMTRRPFTIAERVADLILDGWGDTPGAQRTAADGSDTAADALAIFGQPFAETVTGLDVINFHTNGTFTWGTSRQNGLGKESRKTLTGAIVTPRLAPLNFLCENVPGYTSPPEYFNNNFVTESGTWRSMIAPDEKLIALYNSGSEQAHKIRSLGPVPANRGFFLDLKFATQSNSYDMPGARIKWGGEAEDKYSLEFRQGWKPILCRGTGEPEGSENEWKRIKRLNYELLNLSGGEYRIKVFSCAGRVCIEINGKGFWYLPAVLTAQGTAQVAAGFDPVGAGHSELEHAAWGEGHWVFSTNNCRMRIRGGVIKWCTPGGVKYVGTLVRICPRRVALGDDPEITTAQAGWALNGTTIVAETLVVPNGLQYTMTLTANDDGIQSPFWSQHIIHVIPDFDDPNIPPLDIRPACEGIVIQKAHPPEVPTTQVTLDLDREQLLNLSENFEDYVNDWNPVKIRLRWRYTNGTYSDWKTVFRGHGFGRKKKSNGYNENTMSMTLLCPGVRLIGNSGRIDHTHGPLDLAFTKLIANTDSGLPDAKVYAPDLVKEIVSRVLGQYESEQINGDGDARKFLPAGHPALMDYGGDSCGYLQAEQALASAAGSPPPTHGGFLWPAPFGKDASGWITDITRDDHLVWFIDLLPDTEEPVLIVGRPTAIIAGRTPKRITDNIYIAGDENKFWESASVETRPERDVNRAVAVGREAPGALAALLPSTRIYEAELPPDDPNAPGETWPRTQWLQHNFGSYVSPTFGGVEALATGFIALLEGVELEWPTVIMPRGDTDILWGDIVTFEGNGPDSDQSLGIHGQSFRVEMVEHHIYLAGGFATLTTMLNCRPLNAIEQAAL